MILYFGLYLEYLGEKEVVEKIKSGIIEVIILGTTITACRELHLRQNIFIKKLLKKLKEKMEGSAKR